MCFCEERVGASVGYYSVRTCSILASVSFSLGERDKRMGFVVLNLKDYRIKRKKDVKQGTTKPLPACPGQVEI